MRRVAGCHLAVSARWALQKVRSGEDGEPWVGRRVGEAVLRRQRELSSEASTIASPLAMALSLVDGECHAWWWALKSPTTRVSQPKSLSKRGVRWGEKSGGQLLAGGMYMLTIAIWVLWMVTWIP